MFLLLLSSACLSVTAIEEKTSFTACPLNEVVGPINLDPPMEKNNFMKIKYGFKEIKDFTITKISKSLE